MVKHQNILNKSIESYSLYSNPQNGDIKEGSTNVYFDDLAFYLGWPGVGSSAVWMASRVTEKEFVKALVAHVGLGWVAAATTVGAGIFGLLDRYSRYTGIRLEGKWRY